MLGDLTLGEAGEHGAPEALFAEGSSSDRSHSRPHRLVIAVPAGSRIDAIRDLGVPGTDLVVGTPAVPVGSYTREVLNRLSTGEAEAIRANVRSEESDVTGIVGKLTQGAADAGFLYESDVVPTAGELRSIERAGATPTGSVRNHLAVEVTSITELGNRARVGLGGPQALSAEITAASARELGLTPGMRASASWKAAATRIVRR